MLYSIDIYLTEWKCKMLIKNKKRKFTGVQMNLLAPAYGTLAQGHYAPHKCTGRPSSRRRNLVVLYKALMCLSQQAAVFVFLCVYVTGHMISNSLGHF